MFLELLTKFNTEILPLVYKILFVLSPVFVPLILIYILVLLYVYYIQIRYIAKQEPVLLEIKIPKDIQKSPLAMEIVLGAMAQGGASTYTEAYIGGKVAAWFSLELVSIEGQVHFYIWAPEKKFKALLEHQIYAQYPTVEIYEVPKDKDYVRQVDSDLTKTSVWGLQYKLAKADAYPIKTYVDYNMEKDQKDEYRIDPMTAVLEFLGSVGPGQQVWLQVLIKQNKKEGKKEFRWKEKPDWQKKASEEINKIKIGSMLDMPADKVEAKHIEKAKELNKFPNLTKGQIEAVAAIERSMSKIAFDTMIRGFYVVKEGATFTPINISGLIGAMKQYSSNYLNGLRMSVWTDTGDKFKDLCTVFPFLIKFREAKVLKLKKEMFNAYRLRSHFFPPYQNYRQNTFILTTEEIATMYHFPGNVSATPTLTKIASKKSEPPANLPIKK